VNVGHEPSRSTPDAASGIPPTDGMSPTDEAASRFGEPAGLVGAASRVGDAGDDNAAANATGKEAASEIATVSADTSSEGASPQRTLPEGTKIDPTQPLGASIEASTRLIETFQAGVWRYLRALGCDAALAEDLTQETFVAILQRPFVDHGAMATAAYLRRVAHNLYVTFRRRNGRVVTTDDVEEIGQAWERWAGQDHGEELVEILNDCLSRLTERARKALEMRFRGEHSRNEIADFLTITEHGAKNLMQRAKHQLRECIERKLNRP
jgi:RNA polymerase sigma-70 factor (ECF subfamily)